MSNRIPPDKSNDKQPLAARGVRHKPPEPDIAALHRRALYIHATPELRDRPCFTAIEMLAVISVAEAWRATCDDLSTALEREKQKRK